LPDAYGGNTPKEETTNLQATIDGKDAEALHEAEATQPEDAANHPPAKLEDAAGSTSGETRAVVPDNASTRVAELPKDMVELVEGGGHEPPLPEGGETQARLPEPEGSLADTTGPAISTPTRSTAHRSRRSSRRSPMISTASAPSPPRCAPWSLRAAPS